MHAIERSYKDLIVWQKAIDLCMEIYKATDAFPTEERYALASQLRRAAVSIPSNIAEGRCRGTRKDFAHFLRTALGSSGELETQIEIAFRRRYLAESGYMLLNQGNEEVRRMLHGMLNKLESA